MKKYIDAGILKEQLHVLAYADCNQWTGTSWADAYIHFADFVDVQPTADVRENVHGEWIPSELDHNFFVCSVCKSNKTRIARAWKKSLTDIYRFCPNCGAELRGENDE